jgi:hypothetical protein
VSGDDDSGDAWQRVRLQAFVNSGGASVYDGVLRGLSHESDDECQVYPIKSIRIISSGSTEGRLMSLFAASRPGCLLTW